MRDLNHRNAAGVEPGGDRPNLVDGKPMSDRASRREGAELVTRIPRHRAAPQAARCSASRSPTRSTSGPFMMSRFGVGQEVIAGSGDLEQDGAARLRGSARGGEQRLGEQHLLLGRRRTDWATSSILWFDSIADGVQVGAVRQRCVHRVAHQGLAGPRG